MPGTVLNCLYRLSHLFHIRTCLSSLSLSNATDEEKEELKQISELQDFYSSKQDLVNLQKMDDRFHDALYEMSHRSVLHDTLLPLHRKSMRYRKITSKHKSVQERSVNEHKKIIAAVVAGDGALAQKLMNTHIRNAKEHVIERFMENGQDDC